jgi:hypothetical protein
MLGLMVNTEATHLVDYARSKLMHTLAKQNSARLRLGRVTSLSTATMRIPSSQIFGPTPLRFQLDFLAGPRTPLTEQITVTPGDTVVLQVPPQ